MNRASLQFISPYSVAVHQDPIPDPGPDEVLVKTLVSAISPGTEMLVYRGQWPKGLPVDEGISALAGEFRYPLKYGYSCVGRVIKAGTHVDPRWLGKLVFAFNPHESHFTAQPGQVANLPPELLPEEATLLPNMETAVNFLMDGKPVIGEVVFVLGQGVVGLLTTALLARFPLGGLVTADHYPLRRSKSEALGAHLVLDPREDATERRILEWLAERSEGGFADLTYELSGNPAALNLAISVTGFGGRVVIGSWYGSKRAPIDLGGRFHRSRITIISSQVSSLASGFTGRWSKPRRFGTALRMLVQIRPLGLVTHRFPIARAAEAYALLDEHPEQAIQVVLTYED